MYIQKCYQNASHEPLNSRPFAHLKRRVSLLTSAVRSRVLRRYRNKGDAMKGTEFRAAMTYAGLTQKEFADEMGVHRTVIGRQFAAKEVEPVWLFALAGLLATRNARALTMLVKI